MKRVRVILHKSVPCRMTGSEQLPGGAGNSVVPVKLYVQHDPVSAFCGNVEQARTYYHALYHTLQQTLAVSMAEAKSHPWWLPSSRLSLMSPFTHRYMTAGSIILQLATCTQDDTVVKLIRLYTPFGDVLFRPGAEAHVIQQATHHFLYHMDWELEEVSQRVRFYYWFNRRQQYMVRRPTPRTDRDTPDLYYRYYAVKRIGAVQFPTDTDSLRVWEDVSDVDDVRALWKTLEQEPL